MEIESMRPVRTGSSSLSDDELIVIDPMFDKRVPRWALSRDRYARTFNIPRAHAFDEPSLNECIEKLIGLGIMSVKGEGPKSLCSLTVAGGALWESERKPEWSRYCSLREGVYDATVLVYAFAREVGEDYLALAKACGRYTEYNSAEVIWRRARTSPIYWLLEPRPWRAKVRAGSGEWRAEDRRTFWRNLKSWSDIGDLQTREP